MKNARTPFLLLFFAVFLWSCESENNEVQNELTKTAITKSESARVAFDHECDDECDIPCEEDCETAFGYYCPDGCLPIDAICFSDWGFNRWGWSVNFTAGDRFVLNLVAAAGQCDVTKGIDLGQSVYVTPTENGFHVYYELVFTEYCLNEVHFYIGTEPFPLDKKGEYTAAPGKYTYVNENISDPKRHSFDIELDYEPGDELYVIAHAVVCECD